MKLLKSLLIFSVLTSQLSAHAQLFDEGAEQITGAAIVFYSQGEIGGKVAHLADDHFVVTELIGTDKIAFKFCQSSRPQSECMPVGRASGYSMRAIKDKAQYFTDSGETAEDVLIYSGSGAIALGTFLAIKRISQPKAQILGSVASVLALTSLSSGLVAEMVNKKAAILNTSLSQSDDLTFAPSGLANANQVEIQLTHISAYDYLERLQNLLMTVK